MKIASGRDNFTLMVMLLGFLAVIPGYAQTTCSVKQVYTTAGILEGDSL
jgi:hypothetical protein